MTRIVSGDYSITTLILMVSKKQVDYFTSE